MMEIGSLADVIIRSGGGGAAPDWWDPNGVGLSCIAAYLAKGVANYAASLLDLTGNGNNLVEGNGAVPWAAGTGWAVVEAAAQYFNTGLVPANDQSWSMFVQFAGLVNFGLIAGQSSGVNRYFFLRPDRGAGSLVYANGTNLIVAPNLLAGNTGVAGNQGYRNGAIDGGAIGAGAGVSVQNIFIGCYNNGGIPANFITANIYAVAIYDGGAAAVQAEAAAIAAAMAAL